MSWLFFQIFIVVATFSLTYAVRQHFIMVLVQVLIKGFDLLSGSISLIELVIKSILRNQFFVWLNYCTNKTNYKKLNRWLYRAEAIILFLIQSLNTLCSQEVNKNNRNRMSALCLISLLWSSQKKTVNLFKLNDTSRV